MSRIDDKQLMDLDFYINAITEPKDETLAAPVKAEQVSEIKKEEPVIEIPKMKTDFYEYQPQVSYIPAKEAGPKVQSSNDDIIGLDDLEKELERTRHKHKFGKSLKSTIAILIVVAAIAVLVATTWLPVMHIYGTSMTPTVSEGEIVVSVKGSSFETGDVVSLWYGNKLMVKRVIAGPGDWVDIQSDGTVLVNNVAIDEPYITEKALGDCDIELPYQVPESRYFVMGDHRSTSLDSRNSTIGCIPKEQIVGKIFVRIWPFEKIGMVE